MVTILQEVQFSKLETFTWMHFLFLTWWSPHLAQALLGRNLFIIPLTISQQSPRHHHTQLTACPNSWLALEYIRVRHADRGNVAIISQVFQKICFQIKTMTVGVNGLQTSPGSTAWTADWDILPMRMRSLTTSHYSIILKNNWPF